MAPTSSFTICMFIRRQEIGASVDPLVPFSTKMFNSLTLRQLNWHGTSYSRFRYIWFTCRSMITLGEEALQTKIHVFGNIFKWLFVSILFLRVVFSTLSYSFDCYPYVLLASYCTGETKLTKWYTLSREVKNRPLIIQL